MRSSRYRFCVQLRLFGGLLDAAMDVAQAHRGAGHGFAVDGEFKMARFFQRGMLRADRDDEFFSFFECPSHSQLLISLGRWFKAGEALAQRVNIRRPVIRQEQVLRIWGAANPGSQAISINSRSYRVAEGISPQMLGISAIHQAGKANPQVSGWRSPVQKW